MYVYYFMEKTIKEGFNPEIIDLDSVKNLSQVARKLQEGGLTIPGNLTVNGRLTVMNGSRFHGDRHLFQDGEGAPPVWVGAAWGQPGVYATGGRNLHLGGEGGHVIIPHTTHFGGNVQINGHFAVKGNTDVQHLIVRNGSNFLASRHGHAFRGPEPGPPVYIGNFWAGNPAVFTHGGRLHVGGPQYPRFIGH